MPIRRKQPRPSSRDSSDSTDTVDVFQEGTIFPGVKLCRAGVMVDDIMRMVSANSRVPQLVAGDLQAEIVGVRTAESFAIVAEDVYYAAAGRPLRPPLCHD